MQTLHTISAMRAACLAWRREGARIAFVPTMGNLHEGHLRLIDRARASADRVVASIFVNPLQFGAGEDFQAYPRTPEEDAQLLRARGADALFSPAEQEMYPGGRERMTVVEVPELSGILCGAARPGHFRGVATVVCKLFNIVQPDLAVFGEKDFQQLLVIRRMVADLSMPVEVVGVETVREPDGLAMSSRNRYLGPDERARAPVLAQTLAQLGARLEAGAGDYAALEAQGRAALTQAGLRPDYVAIRRAADLGLPAENAPQELVLLAAAWLGRARLIDNLRVAGPPRR